MLTPSRRMSPEDIKNVKPLKKRTGRPKSKDRVTLVGIFHHESSVDAPTSVNIRFSAKCKTKYQPFYRRIVVGEKACPALHKDCWIPAQDVGRIFVENRTGLGNLVIPTEKDKKELEGKLLRIRSKSAKKGTLIEPGEIVFCRVEDIEDLVMESLSGDLNINIRIIPR